LSSFSFLILHSIHFSSKLDHQSSSSFCHCFELRCLWAWKGNVYLIKFHPQSTFKWNKNIWKNIEATIYFSMQFITYFVWDLYFVIVFYICLSLYLVFLIGEVQFLHGSCFFVSKAKISFLSWMLSLALHS
jgi:hypothetical protein